MASNKSVAVNEPCKKNVHSFRRKNCSLENFYNAMLCSLFVHLILMLCTKFIFINSNAKHVRLNFI